MVIIVRCRLFSFLLALFVMGTSSPAAYADELWPMVQITCAPELNLFRAQLVVPIDLPHDGRALDKSGRLRPFAKTILKSKYGLYQGDEAVHCRIPGVIHRRGDPYSEYQNYPGFTVSLTPASDTSNTSVDHRWVVVKVNGKEVGDIGIGQDDLSFDTVSIEILDFGMGVSITKCEARYDDQKCSNSTVKPEVHPLSRLPGQPRRRRPR